VLTSSESDVSLLFSSTPPKVFRFSATQPSHRPRNTAPNGSPGTQVNGLHFLFHDYQWQHVRRSVVPTVNAWVCEFQRQRNLPSFFLFPYLDDWISRLQILIREKHGILPKNARPDLILSSTIRASKLRADPCYAPYLLLPSEFTLRHSLNIEYPKPNKHSEQQKSSYHAPLTHQSYPYPHHPQGQTNYQGSITYGPLSRLLRKGVRVYLKILIGNKQQLSSEFAA
jgi:hypothetical protein